MVHAHINGRPFFTVKEISILEACRFIGIKIPRFCYQENLSIAGNCRMCLVEVAKVPKPVASCAVLLEDNMVIYTTGPFILKARTNVLEALLLNHPLDCPICDQGGECDLQDQLKMYGNSVSRQYSNKRGVEDKYCGPLIKTIMTRCIHCTRCIRFTNEICGTKFLGTLNRGTNVEVGNYISKVKFSGVLSNVVDLCPVGALTFNPSSYQIRSWEVKALESIDLTDGLGSNIYINYKELDIIRILPKKNTKINESWVSDKGRFTLNNTFNKKNTLNHIKSLFLNFSSSKRILCLVNSETSLETLNTLQHISFLSKGKIKIKNFVLNPIVSNYYFWSNYNKIQNISLLNSSKQLYIFLSSNLNVESTLLNVRIGVNFFFQKKNLYSYGSSFKSTLPVFYFKLNVKNLINIFSAKDYLLTKIFLTNQVFLFYGKSLVSRVELPIISLLKKKIPTLRDYKINTYCNSESISCLNINAYSTNDFQSFDFIYSFFLEDNILLRKKSLLFKNKIIWFNNFSSKITQNVNKFLFLNDLTKEGVYLNLEQRPQKAIKIVNFFVYTESFKYFLGVLKEYYLINSFEKIFDKSYFSLGRRKLFNFLTEILVYPELFDKVTATSLVSSQNILKSSSYYFYNNYPLKLVINDFFRTNTSTKNSIVLLKCSKSNRELENYNFN